MAESRHVLVTGGSGFIAKYIVGQLLRAGFRVRASARTPARFDEIAQAVAPYAGEDALERLDFIALDLSQDAGWNEAMAGIDVVIHTASPFPMSQPRNEDDLIRPAVDGALRAVQAAQAAGITRFIMTSSTAAIAGTRLPGDKSAFDETCWLDTDAPGTTPHAKSKTLAERAVWDWARESGSAMQITMINPGFVLGAPLDFNAGTSTSTVRRMMSGKDPMIPQIGFPCVDVEDIAALHIAAIDAPDTFGQRVMGVERFLWFSQMAEALKAQFPARKIATRIAPNWMIRVIALFDPSLRSLLPILGVEGRYDGARGRKLLGREMKDPRRSLVEAGQFLDRHGHV